MSSGTLSSIAAAEVLRVKYILSVCQSRLMSSFTFKAFLALYVLLGVHANSVDSSLVSSDINTLR